MKTKTDNVVSFDEVKLVREINELHSKVEAANKTSVENALHIGELLTQAKAGLTHGEWLPWIERNCRFGPDTARTYMQAFKNRATRYLSPNADAAPETKPKTIKAMAAKAPSQRKAKPPAEVGIWDEVSRVLGLPRMTLLKGFAKTAMFSGNPPYEELTKEYGKKIPSHTHRGSEEGKAVAEAMRRCSERKYPQQTQAQASSEVEKIVEQVKENDRERFARLLKQARDAEFKRLQSQHHEAVKKEVELLVKETRAELREQQRKANTLFHECVLREKNFDQWMTEVEYKKVLGCLASDRQPPELRARFDEATIIFRRLHTHISHDGKELKLHGWKT